MRMWSCLGWHGTCAIFVVAGVAVHLLRSCRPALDFVRSGCGECPRGESVPGYLRPCGLSSEGSAAARGFFHQRQFLNAAEVEGLKNISRPNISRSEGSLTWWNYNYIWKEAIGEKMLRKIEVALAHVSSSLGFEKKQYHIHVGELFHYDPSGASGQSNSWAPFWHNERNNEFSLYLVLEKERIEDSNLHVIEWDALAKHCNPDLVGRLRGQSSFKYVHRQDGFAKKHFDDPSVPAAAELLGLPAGHNRKLAIDADLRQFGCTTELHAGDLLAFGGTLIHSTQENATSQRLALSWRAFDLDSTVAFRDRMLTGVRNLRYWQNVGLGQAVPEPPYEYGTLCGYMLTLSREFVTFREIFLGDYHFARACFEDPAGRTPCPKAVGNTLACRLRFFSYVHACRAFHHVQLWRYEFAAWLMPFVI